MEVQTIVSLAILGVVVLGGVFAIIVAILRGEMKKFIIEKMEEAEELYKALEKPEKSIKKLMFVLNAVKDKYKILEVFMNAKKFVEKVIEISKQINTK